MNIWGDWHKVTEARKNAAKAFKRPVCCRICGKRFRKIQQLRWHKTKEHQNDLRSVR